MWRLRSVQNWLKYVFTLTTRVTRLATLVRLSPIGQKYSKAQWYNLNPGDQVSNLLKDMFILWVIFQKKNKSISQKDLPDPVFYRGVPIDISEGNKNSKKAWRLLGCRRCNNPMKNVTDMFIFWVIFQKISPFHKRIYRTLCFTGGTYKWRKQK